MNEYGSVSFVHITTLMDYVRILLGHNNQMLHVGTDGKVEPLLQAVVPLIVHCYVDMSESVLGTSKILCTTLLPFRGQYFC
jgi:hypothetical protein